MRIYDSHPEPPKPSPRIVPETSSSGSKWNTAVRTATSNPGSLRRGGALPQGGLPGVMAPPPWLMPSLNLDPSGEQQARVLEDMGRGKSLERIAGERGVTREALLGQLNGTGYPVATTPVASDTGDVRITAITDPASGRTVSEHYDVQDGSYHTVVRQANGETSTSALRDERGWKIAVRRDARTGVTHTRREDDLGSGQVVDKRELPGGVVVETTSQPGGKSATVVIANGQHTQLADGQAMTRKGSGELVQEIASGKSIAAIGAKRQLRPEQVLAQLAAGGYGVRQTPASGPGGVTATELVDAASGKVVAGHFEDSRKGTRTALSTDERGRTISRIEHRGGKVETKVHANGHTLTTGPDGRMVLESDAGTGKLAIRPGSRNEALVRLLLGVDGNASDPGKARQAEVITTAVTALLSPGVSEQDVRKAMQKYGLGSLAKPSIDGDGNQVIHAKPSAGKAASGGAWMAMQVDGQWRWIDPALGKVLVKRDLGLSRQIEAQAQLQVWAHDPAYRAAMRGAQATLGEVLPSGQTMGLLEAGGKPTEARARLKEARGARKAYEEACRLLGSASARQPEPATPAGNPDQPVSRLLNAAGVKVDKVQPPVDLAGARMRAAQGERSALFYRIAHQRTLGNKLLNDYWVGALKGQLRAVPPGCAVERQLKLDLAQAKANQGTLGKQLALAGAYASFYGAKGDVTRLAPQAEALKQKLLTEYNGKNPHLFETGKVQLRHDGDELGYFKRQEVIDRNGQLWVINHFAKGTTTQQLTFALNDKAFRQESRNSALNKQWQSFLTGSDPAHGGNGGWAGLKAAELKAGARLKRTQDKELSAARTALNKKIAAHEGELGKLRKSPGMLDIRPPQLPGGVKPVAITLGDETLYVTPAVAQAYKRTKSPAVLTKADQPVRMEINDSTGDFECKPDWRWVNPKLALAQIKLKTATKQRDSNDKEHQALLTAANWYDFQQSQPMKVFDDAESTAHHGRLQGAYLDKHEQKMLDEIIQPQMKDLYAKGYDNRERSLSDDAIVQALNLNTATREGRETLKKVSGEIRDIGGNDTQIRIVPVFYVDKQDGVQPSALFTVKDDEGKAHYVDSAGKDFDGLKDFQDNNNQFAESGKLVIPAGFKMTPDAKGAIRLEVVKASNVSVSEKIIDPAVSLVAAGAGVLMLTPLAPIAALVATVGATYLLSRTVYYQWNHVNHGGKWTDEESRMNALSAASSVLPMKANYLRYAGMVRSLGMSRGKAFLTSIGAMRTRGTAEAAMGRFGQLWQRTFPHANEAGAYLQSADRIIKAAYNLDALSLLAGVATMGYSLKGIERNAGQMNGLQRADLITGLATGAHGTIQGTIGLARSRAARKTPQPDPQAEPQSARSFIPKHPIPEPLTPEAIARRWQERPAYLQAGRTANPAELQLSQVRHAATQPIGDEVEGKRHFLFRRKDRTYSVQPVLQGGSKDHVPEEASESSGPSERKASPISGLTREQRKQFIRTEVAALLQRVKDKDPEALNYVDKPGELDGQLRFVQDRIAGEHGDINLAQFHKDLDREWRKTLGWTVVSKPFREALAIRAKVKSIYDRVEGEDWAKLKREDPEVLQYLDRNGSNGGQLRCAQWVVGENGDIHMAQFRGVLNRSWAKEMGWSRISMPLQQALACRNKVAAFIQLIEDKKLVPLIKARDWETLERDHPEIMQYIDRNGSRGGALRFVDDGVVGKDGDMNMAQFHSSLDTRWAKLLGWSKIDGTLRETLAVRAVTHELYDRVKGKDWDTLRRKDPGVLKYLDRDGSNSGQICFAQLRVVSEGGDMNMRQYYSKLDREWVRTLGWTVIDKPLEQALACRNNVAAFIQLIEDQELVPLIEARDWETLERDHPTIMQYIDRNGSRGGVLRFVDDMVVGKDGDINMAQFHSLLDKRWVKLLGWSRIDGTLRETLAVRAVTHELYNRVNGKNLATLQREDPEVLQYLDRDGSNGGQICFVQHKVVGKDADINMRHYHSKLDRNWVETFGWSLINNPLPDTLVYREKVGAFIQSIEDQGLMDLFVARDWETLERDHPKVMQYIDRDGSKGGLLLFVQDKMVGENGDMYLAQFTGPLDKKWTKLLGWATVEGTLRETLAVRAVTHELYNRVKGKDWAKLEREDPDALQYLDRDGSNGGQICFAQHKVVGKGGDIHMPHLRSMLDREWVDAFGWTKIDKPLREVVARRKVVEAFIQSIEDQGLVGLLEKKDWATLRRHHPKIMQYIDRDGSKGGLLLFVQDKIVGENGDIYLAQFESLLDQRWMKLLGWSVVKQTFQKTLADRAVARELYQRVKAKDPEVLQYLDRDGSNDGQLLWVQVKVVGKDGDINLAHYRSELDLEWVDAFGWSWINNTLRETRSTRKDAKALYERIGGRDLETLEREDPEVLHYIDKDGSDHGQICFVVDSDTSKNGGIHMSQMMTMVDRAWAKAFGWSKIDQSLSFVGARPESSHNVYIPSEPGQAASGAELNMGIKTHVLVRDPATGDLVIMRSIRGGSRDHDNLPSPELPNKWQGSATIDAASGKVVRLELIPPRFGFSGRRSAMPALQFGGGTGPVTPREKVSLLKTSKPDTPPDPVRQKVWRAGKPVAGEAVSSRGDENSAEVNRPSQSVKKPDQEIYSFISDMGGYDPETGMLSRDYGGGVPRDTASEPTDPKAVPQLPRIVDARVPGEKVINVRLDTAVVDGMHILGHDGTPKSIHEQIVLTDLAIELASKELKGSPLIIQPPEGATQLELYAQNLASITGREVLYPSKTGGLLSAKPKRQIDEGYVELRSGQLFLTPPGGARMPLNDVGAHLGPIIGISQNKVVFALGKNGAIAFPYNQSAKNAAAIIANEQEAQALHRGMGIKILEAVKYPVWKDRYGLYSERGIDIDDISTKIPNFERGPRFAYSITDDSPFNATTIESAKELIASIENIKKNGFADPTIDPNTRILDPDLAVMSDGRLLFRDPGDVVIIPGRPYDWGAELDLLITIKKAAEEKLARE